MPGRVRYYGCPAEEGGSAKGFMVRAGVFDDVDVAISWHPSAFTGVNRAFSLACVEMEFHFSGRSAHAAASPHLGRSALDAVELDERRRQLSSRTHPFDGAHSLCADRRWRHRAQCGAG